MVAERILEVAMKEGLSWGILACLLVGAFEGFWFLMEALSLVYRYLEGCLGILYRLIDRDMHIWFVWV